MATRTFIQICQAVADSLSLRVSGTATGGTSTTIVAANYPFKTSDADADTNRYRGTEAYITSSNWTGTPNPNSVTLDAPSTGTLTLGNAHAGDTVANGDTFDLYLRGVSIVTIKDCVNHALRNLRYVTRTPLSFVSDADMEEAGTTSWDSSNATVAKVSSSTTLLRGRQSLSVTATSANGYALSTALHPDGVNASQWYVRAAVRTPTSTVRLLLYDLTNSVTLESADSNGVEYNGILEFTADVPSTTKNMVVRLMQITSGDLSYWDDVMAYPLGVQEVPLPGWITSRDQVIGLVRGYEGVESAYDDRLQIDYGFDLVDDPGNAFSPLRIRPNRSLYGPVWIEASRPYPALSADSDTTTCDRDWLELAASVELLRRLQNQAPSQEVDAWRNEYRARRKELNAVNSRRMPARRLRYVV